MDDYSSQWHHYRVLNRIGFAVFAIFLGVLPLSIIVDRMALLAPNTTKPLFIGLGVAALLSLGVVLSLITFWRCPRCHEWYARRSVVGWSSLKRQCVHCGLKLYEGEAMPANHRLERP
jgi:hypothetical protein